LGADYLYTGSTPAGFMLPNGLKEVQDYAVWRRQANQMNIHPLLSASDYLSARTRPQGLHIRLNFVQFTLTELTDELADALGQDRNIVGVATTDNSHAMPELRRLFVELVNRELTLPMVVQRRYPDLPAADLPLYAATDMGGLLIDGFGDGLLLQANHSDELKQLNGLAFGILQAARTRITKTEYISCPSCGRTLFDLQETTALIRQRTDHLKGVKIGIMGCIVNGPGEMADADYGYVGIGRDKIALYRGQQVMKKSVSAANAVDELIELIREDGRWLEPAQAAVL
ncbi:MAG TPA: flavodoxin-dependent (E)-4-hydroxy-3-methylbut-2-enyl-diphosphate synthase, partial [Fibrella sp.]